MIIFIDDATSELMALRFAPAETSRAYLDTMNDYLRRVHHRSGGRPPRPQPTAAALKSGKEGASNRKASIKDADFVLQAVAH